MIVTYLSLCKRALVIAELQKDRRERESYFHAYSILVEAL
jgi:hypothetical protein